MRRWLPVLVVALALIAVSAFQWADPYAQRFQTGFRLTEDDAIRRGYTGGCVDVDRLHVVCFKDAADAAVYYRKGQSAR